MAQLELRRRPDWQVRLKSYLEAVHRRAFAPGAHDCAMFAAGAIEAMTGADLAEGWRGQYATLVAGRRAMRKAGFEDHVAFAASLLPEIPPSFAQVGDIGTVPDEDGELALCVVQGEAVYSVTETGLAIADRLTMTRAFRV